MRGGGHKSRDENEGRDGKNESRDKWMEKWTNLARNFKIVSIEVYPAKGILTNRHSRRRDREDSTYSFCPEWASRLPLLARRRGRRDRPPRKKRMAQFQIRRLP
jgi:hypothetical protein